MSKTVVIRHINDRELNLLTAPQGRLFRPSVSWRRMFRAALLLLLASLLASLLGIAAYAHIESIPFSRQRIFSLTLLTLPFVFAFCSILFMNQILIQGILIYQRHASASVRLRCRLDPSCSSFAVLSLRRYGPVVGVIKSISRMRRCGRPEDHSHHFSDASPVARARVLTAAALSSLIWLISLLTPREMFFTWLLVVAQLIIVVITAARIVFTKGASDSMREWCSPSTSRSFEQLAASILICEAQPSIPLELARRLAAVREEICCSTRTEGAGATFSPQVVELVDRIHDQMMSGQRELSSASLELLEAALSTTRRALILERGS